MQTVIDKLSDIFSAGFSAAGYDAALGRVVVSARPDLCQFQCNGAMSAAKQYRKAPPFLPHTINQQKEECICL